MAVLGGNARVLPAPRPHHQRAMRRTFVSAVDGKRHRKHDARTRRENRILRLAAVTPPRITRARFLVARASRDLFFFFPGGANAVPADVSPAVFAGRCAVEESKLT